MRHLFAWLLLYSLLAGLAFWVFGLLFLWLRQDSFIFHPQPLQFARQQELESYEMRMQTADGVELGGWLLPQPEAERGVFFLGGNAQEISGALLDLRAGLELTAAGFNYRGFGTSDGDPSEQAIRADALATFDHTVAASGIPAEDWLVVGRSLGTNPAALIASQRDVAGLALITPYDSIAEIAARLYWMYPVKRMLRHPFDTVPYTKDIAASTLVLKAQFDVVVPHASTDRLLAQWQGSAAVDVVTVPGSWHGDIDNQQQFWWELAAFKGRLRPR